MSFQFNTSTDGGRTPCYRFFEDLMLCVKVEGIHRTIYKCHEQREDYHECITNKKKVSEINLY